MIAAMVGDEKVGSTMVGMNGMFNDLEIEGAEPGAMLMFSVMMGEGDAMMEYMASTDEDVMVGMQAEIGGPVTVMAFTTEAAKPTPTKTAAQQMEAMRGPRGATGAQGPEGPAQGEPGADVQDGRPRRRRSQDGADLAS